METPPEKKSKPTRQQTLERCETVATQAVGAQTPLDQAFAAFDDAVGDDPATLTALQDHVRALLRRGM